MASYFNSNHTTSRFLANNSTPASNSTPNPPPHPNRSRVPSSKHFSTSLHQTDRPPTGSVTLTSSASNGTTPVVHPLRNTYVCSFSPQCSPTPEIHFFRWVFYFRQQRAPGNKNVNYEEGIKKISAFSSVRFTSIIIKPFLSSHSTPYRLNLFGHYGHTLPHHPPFNLQPITYSFTPVSADQYGKTR